MDCRFLREMSVSGGLDITLDFPCSNPEENDFLFLTAKFAP
jgi:hypothetical protein